MFRWLALATLLACGVISGTFRARARRESGTIARRNEPPWLLAGRGVVALPLLLAIVLHLVNPPWMARASWPASPALRWLGVALGFVAVPAAWWVFRSIGRNVSETVLVKERHELVTCGPYRWIRHPLYATGLLALAGIGLMLASWVILLLTLIALLAIRLVVIPLEEKALTARFGEAYRDYACRTGRLVPRVRERA